jgi:hypothetical protein
LTDEPLAAVVSGTCPLPPSGRGTAWQALPGRHKEIRGWLEQGLTLTKIHTLPVQARGWVVSHPVSIRHHGIGVGAAAATVPVLDGEPGSELQVDFGRLGWVPDKTTGARRVVWGLVFTAVYSRARVGNG